MSNSQPFQINDKIIEYGKVFKIFKIKKPNRTQNITSRTIFYKAWSKANNDNHAVYSIPEENLQKANIRKPISKSELKKLLQYLAQKIKHHDQETDLDVNAIREKLCRYDPWQTSHILKDLWFQKSNPETNFTKSKQDALATSINQLSEEFALVGKTSLLKAIKKIKSALKKGASKHL